MRIHHVPLVHVPLVLAAALAAACATTSETPPPGASTAPMVHPPTGTRWVMKSTVHNERTSTTQVHAVTRTVLRDGSYQGKPVYRISNGPGVDLYDQATGSWLAQLDRNAQELESHEPHSGDFSSPLWVGKEWVARFTRHQRKTGTVYHNSTLVWTVKALEELTVPAGTFKVYRVEAWPEERQFVKKWTRWYAPELKIVVKEITEAMEDFTQIGAWRDPLKPPVKTTEELVSYSTSAQLIPSLVATLRDGETRLATLWDLAHIGPPAREAMPALIGVLRSERLAAVRTAAVVAVRAIGVTSSDVPALVPALGDPDINVRIPLVAVLKPHAAEARSILERQMTGADVEGRKTAARALGGLGRELPSEVLPVLGRALDDADAQVRATVVHALADVGSPAMSALRGALRHRDGRVRATAVQVIITVPEQQADAIAAIIPLLDDTDVTVRTHAVQALGAMGSMAGAARERLTRIAERDPSPEIRELAKRALEDLGPR